MQLYHPGSLTIFMVLVSAISLLVLWVAWRLQAHRMHWLREWRWSSGWGGGVGGGMKDWADINDAADKAEVDPARDDR
jgi:hypothetical protein